MSENSNSAQLSNPPSTAPGWSGEVRAVLSLNLPSDLATWVDGPPASRS